MNSRAVALLLFLSGLAWSANDFSGDANCIAVWNFDDNLEDSKGTLDLTDVNTLAFSTTHKEGTKSASFYPDENQKHAYQSDTNLPAGFPFKNGDDDKNISVCFWMLTNLDNWQGLVNKGEGSGSGTCSFELVLTDAFKVRMAIGYNSGGSQELLLFGTACHRGDWYHVGATYNGATKTYRLRVVDANDTELASDLTGTSTNSINVEAGEFVVGAIQNEGDYVLNGLIDELVVFNDILSVSEINAIRGGTFGAEAPPATTSVPRIISSFDDDHQN